MTEKGTHTSDCDWHVDQYPWECTCGFIPKKKAMDDLIAQDADLIDKLRDTDSYYRIQEKHWCIDHEELERQRLAAAALVETQAAELAKFKALAETLAGALENALRCTPQAKHGAIIYDCGDPWEILTEALRQYKEARDVERDVYASETCIGERRCIAASLLPIIAAEREDAARRALEWMRPQVEEMLFLKYWRQDGMNTEQARIHAKARTDEGLAAAPIAQFREAGNG